MSAAHMFSTVGTCHRSSSHLKANPDFFLTLTKLFLVPKPDQVKHSELIIHLKTYIIDVCVSVNLGLWGKSGNYTLHHKSPVNLQIFCLLTEGNMYCL